MGTGRVRDLRRKLTSVILSKSSFVFTARSDSVKADHFFMLWIIAAIISTCYTLTWDIKMDWGLLDKNAGENRFLREETVYRSKVRQFGSSFVASCFVFCLFVCLLLFFAIFVISFCFPSLTSVVFSLSKYL